MGNMEKLSVMISYGLTPLLRIGQNRCTIGKARNKTIDAVQALSALKVQLGQNGTMSFDYY